ncbi:hypothetical protein BY996DRAFT_6443147 [Phakopsora pachyrhizi]|nr:hypothetical protein BY996DRAFT_6443147 [Phakopsora pachyrhizi]
MPNLIGFEGRIVTKSAHLFHPNQFSQEKDKEHLKTEPDGGNVASSGGTSSPKVIDLLEADDAQEETGFTLDRFSGESSCSLSKEEKEEKEEEDKENDCDGRIDA